MAAKRTVTVIGGGPAGFLAAGTAAGLGAEAVLIEKMRLPGRKLRITGKGRCNLTNIAPMDKFLRHYGTGGRFLKHALHRFSPADLTAFIEGLGIATVAERGGRVFPDGAGAPEVTDALILWARKTGVRMLTDTPARSLIIEDGAVRGVMTDGGREFRSDTVIVATGGKSYKVTGSTGDGYRIAEQAEHTVIEPRPALVPLKTVNKLPTGLDGLTLKNTGVALLVDGARRGYEFGEVLFRDGALDGPAVLTVSLVAVDTLREGKHVAIELDLKPALDHAKLDARLLRDIAAHPNQPVTKLLDGLLPRALGPVFASALGLDTGAPLHQFTATDRKGLRLMLKEWRLDVSGHRGFDRAIVTAGGISLREVNPKTMESRLIRGLYFAGEVLDVQADTGGYNLQAAFSTGRLAGECAILR